MNNISLKERLAYRTYLIAQIGISLILLIGLALWGGLSRIDIGIVAVLLIASTAFYLTRRTKQTPEMQQEQALQKKLANGEKYTLVELYGTYCTGCVQVKPDLDKFESEAPANLQVIRLDIERAPGVMLKQGKRMFTPTFQLYDPKGKLVSESYMNLDRARILYELEQGAKQPARR